MESLLVLVLFLFFFVTNLLVPATKTLKEHERGVIQVEDFRQATLQAAQTSLSDIVGQRGRDELLAQREQVNAQLQALVERQASAWGVQVSRAEITVF
jgi:regulator of protease activity HflC (stomatin/prohibitin superfamily)